MASGTWTTVHSAAGAHARGNNLRRTRVELQQNLKLAFERVLRPEHVRKVEITKVEGTVVLGFLLTTCPVERLEHWKDFKARLSTGPSGPLDYAIVDGKKLVDRTKHTRGVKVLTSPKASRA
jgi:hypothetical protein